MTKTPKVIKTSKLKDSIFFTEGDPLQQDLCRIGARSLESKVKLLILLSSRIVIPSTHIVESDMTRNLFLANPELLSKRIFLPSMGLGVTSFRDLIQAKQADPAFYFDYGSSQLQEIAASLDESLDMVVIRDSGAQSAEFQQSLIADLLEDNSPLIRRMRIGKSTRRELAERIGELPKLSRDDIAVFSKRLSRRAQRALLRHSNALYYLFGGRWNASDPEVHPSSIPIYEDQFNRALSRYSERLFAAVIRGLGLSQDLLDTLGIKQIIELRDEEPVKRFRKAYLALVDESRCGHSDMVKKLVGDSTQEEPVRLQDKTLEESVVEAIGTRVALERAHLGKHERIKRWWSLTSFATTLLSAIGGIVVPEAVGAAAAVGTIAGTAGVINTFTGLTDPLIDYLFRLQPNEFVLFAAHMVQSEKASR